MVPLLAAYGHGRVQSLASWWTDTASYRMHRKFSPFEKQSANQTCWASVLDRTWKDLPGWQQSANAKLD
jgi:hypothetical protein